MKVCSAVGVLVGDVVEFCWNISELALWWILSSFSWSGHAKQINAILYVKRSMACIQFKNLLLIKMSRLYELAKNHWIKEIFC